MFAQVFGPLLAALGALALVVATVWHVGRCLVSSSASPPAPPPAHSAPPWAFRVDAPPQAGG